MCSYHGMADTADVCKAGVARSGGAPLSQFRDLKVCHLAVAQGCGFARHKYIRIIAITRVVFAPFGSRAWLHSPQNCCAQCVSCEFPLDRFFVVVVVHSTSSPDIL